MEHPLIANRKGFLYYCFSWVANATLLFALLWFFDEQNPWFALVDTLSYMVPLFPLGLSLWYVVRYTDAESVGIPGLILHHLAAAIVVVLLWISTTYYFVHWYLGSDHPHIQFWDRSIHWFVLGCFIYYDFIVLLYYLVVYYRNFQQKLLHESVLENLVKEAELSALKSQINPHFLFNSLNSVSALTLSAPDRAREMVVKLSTFLRYSLAQDLKEHNTLENELNNSRLYLEIERVRFGDRLQLEFEIEDNCGEKRLPNLILQPVFENAIKHGVHESTEPVTVHTRCRYREGMLCVSIGNNYDPEGIPRRGNGIGLKNIQQRLQLIYNRCDLMRITKTEDYFEVHLEFPQ